MINKTNTSKSTTNNNNSNNNRLDLKCEKYLRNQIKSIQSKSTSKITSSKKHLLLAPDT